METTTLLVNTTGDVIENITATVANIPKKNPTKAPDWQEWAVCLTSSRFYYGNWIFRNRQYIEVSLAFVGMVIVLVTYAKKISKGTPYFYMCVLSIADFSYVACQVLSVKIANNVYNYNFGPVGCAFLEYCWTACFEFAIGVLVVMTLERMLVITFPFKVQRFFTIKKALIILGVLLLAVLAANTPIMWAYSVRPWPLRNGAGTHYRCIYITKLFYPVHVIRFFVFTAVPIILLFLCNIMIIVTMFRSVKQKTQMTGNEAGEKAISQFKHITAQTLSVSVSFCLLCVPQVVIYWPDTYLTNKGRDFSYCSEKWLNRYVASESAKFMANLQHGINAYMYCLVSAKFRKEFLQVLHIIKPTKDAGSRTASTGLSGSVTTAPPPGIKAKI